MLNLVKIEPRRVMHLMRHANKKIQHFDERMILLLGQMSRVEMLGTNPDYLAKEDRL